MNWQLTHNFFPHQTPRPPVLNHTLSSKVLTTSTAPKTPLNLPNYPHFPGPDEVISPLINQKLNRENIMVTPLGQPDEAF